MTEGVSDDVLVALLVVWIEALDAGGSGEGAAFRMPDVSEKEIP